jgi:hypothetical protein
MSTGQFHGWYIIGALANDFAAVGVDQAISRARAFEKSPNHFLIVPRPGFRAPTDNLTTFSNPFSGASRTLPKPQGKHQKVRFLSSPLKNPGFTRVFRISGQFLWSSGSAHAGSVHGGMQRCISRRAPQIESFFESRESSKHWGFACPGLVPIHVGQGGRIRTRL